MIVKYRIVSGENDNFVRDIEIYENSTFYDLHLAIQDACEYDGSMMTSFYTSNNKWEKRREIAMEIIDPKSQEDVLLMNETKINDFSVKKGKKLLYLYDLFSVRFLFIEIVNIRDVEKEDENLEFPICTLSQGDPPIQFFIDDIDPEDMGDDFENSFGDDFDDEFSDDYNDDHY